MANINFTQLPDSANLQSSDIFPIVRAGTTDYKASASYIAPFIGLGDAVTGFSLKYGSTAATLIVLTDLALNQSLLTTSSPTFANLSVSTQYSIGASSVLTATTLGTSVVNSSLTKLGLTSAGYVKTDAAGNLSAQIGVPITDITQTSTVGNLYYGNGTSLTSLPIGTNGQYLTIIGGLLAWGPAGTTIPNPLVVGSITIDGSGPNQISSTTPQNFYISSANSNALTLISKGAVPVNGVVLTNQNPYTSDIGATIAAGTNVSAANTGTYYRGRHTIITGSVKWISGAPSLIHSGGVVGFSQPFTGTFTLTFPDGLFLDEPYCVGCANTDILGAYPYVFTRLKNINSVSFVTSYPDTGPANNINFDFVVMGPC